MYETVVVVSLKPGPLLLMNRRSPWPG